MTFCLVNRNIKDSDLRFFLRLVASWGLFLLMWTIFILCSVMTIIIISMAVGHTFNKVTGFGNEPQINEFHTNFGTHGVNLMVLDILVGILVIFISGLILGILFFMGYNLKYYHYDIWYQAELKFLQENGFKREEALLVEFSELEDYNKKYNDGQSKDFWHTIPEYLKLKHYFNKHFPRCSFRRYICWSAFYTTGDLIPIILGCIIFRQIGRVIIADHVFTDRITKQPISWIFVVLIEWAFGFIAISIIGLVCIGIWNTVIASCLKEWKIHREKKLAAMTKFD